MHCNAKLTMPLFHLILAFLSRVDKVLKSAYCANAGLHTVSHYATYLSAFTIIVA